jgi:hypothetical protein
MEETRSCRSGRLGGCRVVAAAVAGSVSTEARGVSAPLCLPGLLSTVDCIVRIQPPDDPRNDPAVSGVGRAAAKSVLE